MYCRHCGSLADPGSAFCSACGKAVAVSTPLDQSLVESCEIVFRETTAKQERRFGLPTRAASGHLIAAVTGGSIQHPAGMSVYISAFDNNSEYSETRACCDDLVYALTQNGWVEQPRRGSQWYSHRFSRTQVVNRTELTFCVIGFEKVNQHLVSDDIRFVALGYGLNPKTISVQSHTVRVNLQAFVVRNTQPSSQEIRGTHSDFVRSLQRSGWEPITRQSDRWWVAHFRRISDPMVGSS